MRLAKVDGAILKEEVALLKAGSERFHSASLNRNPLRVFLTCFLKDFVDYYSYLWYDMPNLWG